MSEAVWHDVPEDDFPFTLEVVSKTGEMLFSETVDGPGALPSTLR